MGIVSPLGLTIPEFCQSLRAGRTGIDRVEDEGFPLSHVRIGAVMKGGSLAAILAEYASLEPELGKRAQRSARRAPLSVEASVVAALQSWQQARLAGTAIPGDRMGLVVAGSNVNQAYQFSQYRRFVDALEFISPSYGLHYLDTDHVGTLSEIFGIHGEGFTVGGASASGNVSILKGMQMIQAGLADVCLVVGALVDLSPMEWQAFANMGALGGKRFQDAPEQACRPFDQDHEGFIYGQAAGALILESGESASRRGVGPLAEILGGSLLLDGNRLSTPSAHGEARAMLQALQRAGVSPAEVDYINAHGTSSPLGDKTEAEAIHSALGDRVSEIWVNATKGLTGHTLHAAGVVEAIATVLQIQEGFVHPNRNLVRPIDATIRFSGTHSVDADIRVALSNSFGFGGINSSIVLRRSLT